MENRVSISIESEIFDEVLEGLSRPQKFLPSKLFYDEKGSRLFDQICELEEYYPTRTEMKIMEENIGEIASLIGEGTLLVEPGSGSSKKIRLMLDNIPGLAGYVPIDICSDHLNYSTEILKHDYPDLDIYPVGSDFTKSFELPKIAKSYNHILVYYPGSTIGNFTPAEAKAFLGKIAVICGRNSGLLIGVDLKKNKDILESAYNDNSGITSKFNFNVLERINDELDSNFELSKFKHHAFYNDNEGRIEMHLISTIEQRVCVGDILIYFAPGENIITELSYKYSLQGFEKLVSESYSLKKVWNDNNKLFSVQYMTAK
jgi:dimethylhistidine N-methyltransferase